MDDVAAMTPESVWRRIALEDREVLMAALAVFVVDRTRWSDPPLEQVGRAMALQHRLQAP